MTNTDINLEQFFGNVASRNPGQFTFAVVDGGVSWARAVPVENPTHFASGTLALIPGESYEAMHQRFWDHVFATPWAQD